MSSIQNSPLQQTAYQLPNQTGSYQGKVRDVYFIGDDYLVAVATDRISAFDYILPRLIPSKGAVLNQLAAYFLRHTAEVCPNWLIETPHPNVSLGWRCTALPIEMVVRGYLAGHAWRIYRNGGRSICGVALPEGLKENQRLPHPIITPTTKAHEGHDEDISRQAIIAKGIVSEAIYLQMEQYALALFAKGTTMAEARGLVLVDTKYEFGLRRGQLMLIDEVHTADSSRYFEAEDYHQSFAEGKAPRQLSKEFVREWLLAHGFMGKDGQTMPEMSNEVVASISARYVELYERLTGSKFEQADGAANVVAEIEQLLTTRLSLLIAERQ